VKSQATSQPTPKGLIKRAAERAVATEFDLIDISLEHRRGNFRFRGALPPRLC